MSRRSWAELPEGVRHAVEARCGGIDTIVDAPAGTACDFAGTVVTPGGRLFCKATHQDARQAWMLRNEIRVNEWLPAGAAPRLVWNLNIGAWLVAAFEHVEGRHADLSRGSPDLDAVATALDRISQCDTTGWPIPVQPIQDRWRKTDDLDLGDVSRYAGPTLIHTDPVASNLIVTPQGEVKIVDWGWPGTGAAWIDTALLVVYLVHLGHHPAEAEAWAARSSAWASADPETVDAFATTIWAIRSHQAHTHPAPHRAGTAASAKKWLDHRRSTHGSHTVIPRHDPRT